MKPPTTSRPVATVIAAVIAAVLFAAGCGGSDASTTPADGSTSTGSTSTGSTGERSTAPDGADAGGGEAAPERSGAASSKEVELDLDSIVLDDLSGLDPDVINERLRATAGEEAAAAPAPADAAGAAGSAGTVEPLADATHLGWITGADAARRVIAFDVGRFVTGPAAIEAALRDGATTPDDPIPPGGVWVANASPLVRELPLAADAPISVFAAPDGSATEPATLERVADLIELGRALSEAPGMLATVTVRSGTVVSIEQFRLPSA